MASASLPDHSSNEAEWRSKHPNEDGIGMLAVRERVYLIRPMFPFAAGEWRTKIEGVSEGMQGREEKGDVQWVPMLYFVLKMK
jgi:hypothetical protein